MCKQNLYIVIWFFTWPSVRKLHFHSSTQRCRYDSIHLLCFLYVIIPCYCVAGDFRVVQAVPFSHSAFPPSPALPAPWERQEVHLAPCPCGADHVAWTVPGHFYPGVGRIWNCPGRYLLIKIWSKLKKVCVLLFNWGRLSEMCIFLCVSLFFSPLSFG